MANKKIKAKFITPTLGENLPDESWIIVSDSAPATTGYVDEKIAETLGDIEHELEGI